MWSQGTTSGSDRGSAKVGGRGRRGGGGKGGDDGNKGGEEVSYYCCGQKGHIKPNCPKKEEIWRKCNKVGHLQAMCKGAGISGTGGGEGSKRQPEAAQFDTFENCISEVTIGEELLESMMVVVDIVVEAEHQIMGSSHHITSTREGMIKSTVLTASEL